MTFHNDLTFNTYFVREPCCPHTKNTIKTLQKRAWNNWQMSV